MILTLLGVVGCDHGTKAIAESSLVVGRPVAVAGRAISLELVFNDDVAFSALRMLGFEREPWLLIGASALALVMVGTAWLSMRKHASRLQHIGLVLVVGGGVANLLDRVVRRHVVDFIHLAHWPIFNVADVAIVVGIAFIGFASVRRRQRARLNASGTLG